MEKDEGVCFERSSAQNDFYPKAPLVMSGDTLLAWCMHVCMHIQVQRSEAKAGYLPLFLSTPCFEEGISLNMEPTDLARLTDRQALEIFLSPPVSVTFHDKIL